MLICRDLTALFAPSPKPAVQVVPHDQPLAVAGARHDVSLERMQVGVALTNALCCTQISNHIRLLCSFLYMRIPALLLPGLFLLLAATVPYHVVLTASYILAPQSHFKI